MTSGKAVLEFDMSDPDQREAHGLALKALDYKLIIDEIFSRIRRKEKSDSPPPASWDDMRQLVVECTQEIEE